MDANNTAAMREALEATRSLLLPQCNGGTAFARACAAVCDKIASALSAPPRNCDVGTAEEQSQRFDCFCKIEKVIVDVAHCGFRELLAITVNCVGRRCHTKKEA